MAATVSKQKQGRDVHAGPAYLTFETPLSKANSVISLSAANRTINLCSLLMKLRSVVRAVFWHGHRNLA